MATSPDESEEFDSIHDAYSTKGPEQFYRDHGSQYRNPHEPIIRSLIQTIIPKWNLDLSNVLDLAAGSGEVTLAIAEYLKTHRGMGFQPVAKPDHGQDALATIHAIDPYTSIAYKERTGIDCEQFTFEQIAEGVLRDRSYSTVFCSFAMHLVEESRLPMLCWELSQITQTLIILTPHKRPVIPSKWGWKLEEEVIRERVRARQYTQTRR